jgi:hypothetical protein
MALVQVCTDYDSTGDVCNSFGFVDSVLLPPSAQSNIDLLIQGGFDPDVALTGFFGVISLWGIGIAVGLIISMIRKVRV